MKNWFIVRLLTAVVEAATGAVEAPLTSEKLEKLKADYRVAFKAIQAVEDPFSKEAIDAKLAAFKIEGEIAAEKAALQKAVNDAKIAEQRNLRLALNTAQFAAYDNLLKVKADKKSTPEQIAEAQTAFDTAKELVDNELLAKYANSSTAKKAKAVDGQPVEKASSANKAAILEMFHAGKTHAEIEAAGYKRSTVWHTINDWKKANVAS